MIYKNTPTDRTEKRYFRTEATRPMAMLAQCPAYAPTPLYLQADIAQKNSIAELYIKDESSRMRLGSFKALGGAFAVAQMISDAAGTADFESEGMKSIAAGMTFLTASAGNHGLSVAAGARIFGAHAIIFLSTKVPESFANRIRALNAEVVRVEGSYEDSVEAAKAAAHSEGRFLLADGSWDGYIERPALVMEGYTVLAEECRAEFARTGRWPTHVILQAGVGGLAAAVAAHIREYWDVQPQVIVVEPDAAPCLLESMKAQHIMRAEGPDSNMGRLDCKDASLIAFDSLKSDADLFVTITDDEASAAVSDLATRGTMTTPSGAASIAALSKLGLQKDSRCLAIVTEGQEDG